MDPTFLWLIFMNATVPLIGIIWWSEKIGGTHGLVAGLIIGLVIGACNVWGIKTAYNALLRWRVRCKDKKKLLYWPDNIGRILFVAAYFWMFISGLFGILIANLILKK